MTDTIHYAVLDNLTGHVTVMLGETILAASDQVILLKETYKDKVYPGVMYFPRADVNMDLFSKAEGFHTRCPIKGVASYYDLKMDAQLVAHSADRKQAIEHAAWSYENPMPEHARISNYISFDLSKFNPEIVTS